MTPPGAGPLVIRGGYSRFFYPLAGRYLDYGNLNGLSGDEYKWVDANQDGQFFYDETTTLLRRFGGAVSQIDPHLTPPHVDEFFASVEWKSANGFFARARAFRRIERDRIAALNTGVPFSAYQPRSIVDPGPEKELFKPEKEFRKPEGFKPEKEFLKPEKELSKPEKETGGFSPEQVEQIAQRVAELMKANRPGMG